MIPIAALQLQKAPGFAVPAPAAAPAAAPAPMGFMGRMQQIFTPERLRVIAAGLHDLSTGGNSLPDLLQELDRQRAQIEEQRWRRIQQDQAIRGWKVQEGRDQRLQDWAQGQGGDALIDPETAYRTHQTQDAQRDQYAWQRTYDNEHPEAITPYQAETLRNQRLQIAASGDRRTQLTPQERRQWQNSYNDDVQQTLTGLGNLRTSIPYAGTVIRNGGHVEGVPGVNFRLNDQALLRAAARAQTGPGVLTESEVFGTLSPSLQQDLIRGRAYADITQSGIRPEDRLALARFVQLGADNASRDLWRRYEGADATLSGMGHTTAEVGIAPPDFVHPDDLRSFQSVPESALRQGQNYTAPSGRRYTYLGNGQFRFLDYHEYNPANRVRAGATPNAAGAPPPGFTPEGWAALTPEQQRRARELSARR